MPNENVEKWKQPGDLYLWRYTEGARNFPGWHFTAADVCCHGLAHLMEIMLSARWASQKSLKVTAPIEDVLGVPNNRGGTARWASPKTLVLKHPKGKVDDQHFALEEDGTTITVSAGRQKLELLKECVRDIPNGKGDYSIGIGETQLWFWWMVRRSLRGERAT